MCGFVWLLIPDLTDTRNTSLSGSTAAEEVHISPSNGNPELSNVPTFNLEVSHSKALHASRTARYYTFLSTAFPAHSAPFPAVLSPYPVTVCVMKSESDYRLWFVEVCFALLWPFVVDRDLKRKIPHNCLQQTKHTKLYSDLLQA